MKPGAAPLPVLPEFLRSAPAAVRESFAREARPFRLQKGIEWVVIGERCGAIGFPISGTIRIYLIGTGVVGFCPAYCPLGISTSHVKRGFLHHPHAVDLDR